MESLEDRLTPVTLPSGVAESMFASGLTAPTAMAAAFGGRVFVAEQGGTSRVVVFGGVQNAMVASFLAGDVNARGGVPVATYRSPQQAKVSIITGAAAGSPPYIQAFNVSGISANGAGAFSVFEESFLGGVFVG